MMEVWKYPLDMNVTVLNMPLGAKPLTVQDQQGQPCLWAVGEPAAPTVRHAFRLVGTGFAIADKETERYVGSFQQMDGALVWHVFDLGEEPTA